MPWQYKHFYKPFPLPHDFQRSLGLLLNQTCVGRQVYRLKVKQRPKRVAKKIRPFSECREQVQNKIYVSQVYAIKEMSRIPMAPANECPATPEEALQRMLWHASIRHVSLSRQGFCWHDSPMSSSFNILAWNQGYRRCCTVKISKNVFLCISVTYILITFIFQELH